MLAEGSRPRPPTRPAARSESTPREVRADDHVELFGVETDPRREGVHQYLIGLDAVLVGDRFDGVAEETVRLAHDVGLVDDREAVVVVAGDVVAGELGESFRGRLRDDAGERRDVLRQSILVTRVDALGVLPEEDQVRLGADGVDPRIRFRGPNVDERVDRRPKRQNDDVRGRLAGRAEQRRVRRRRERS